MISPYGKREWLLVLAIGLTLTVLLAIFVVWWAAVIVVLAAAALLAFFRDPARKTPTLRGLMISPADGRVSSVHQLEHFDAFDGPATCIRIFLSVLDVHVQRSPCHGRVVSIVHKSGKFINALKPDAADHNESVTMLLRHPTNEAPVAAVRQLVGAIARRIVCGVAVGDILQRGQRYGMIKFGSTVELYLPGHDRHDIEVEVGQYVYGGQTVLARTRAELQSDRTAEEAVDATATREEQEARRAG